MNTTLIITKKCEGVGIRMRGKVPFVPFVRKVPTLQIEERNGGR